MDKKPVPNETNGERTKMRGRNMSGRNMEKGWKKSPASGLLRLTLAIPLLLYSVSSCHSSSCPLEDLKDLLVLYTALCGPFSGRSGDFCNLFFATPLVAVAKFRTRRVGVSRSASAGCAEGN
jgi:hypothetical protein